MKAVFFDLDNTLYDSREYCFGAFKEISDYLSEKYNIPSSEIYKNLTNLWQKKTSIYPYLFDDLLKILDIKNGKLTMNIVKIFNGYKGKLKPYSEVISTLKKLKKGGYKLGIITDGNVERQKRKIKLLGIKNFFETIIYTKEIEPKPSESPFLVALGKIKIKPRNAFYVADNPLVDFEGAKKIGMITLRIKKGEFMKIPKNKYIDFEIKNFSEILNIVK